MPTEPAGDECEAPCPVCGCEERGQGGYLSCECLAPASPSGSDNAEPVAWIAKSREHGGVKVETHALKFLLVEWADNIYGRNAYDLVPLYAASPSDLCSDCPPPGYPTDATRCEPCPRRSTIEGEDA